jgi:MYXO-CTERM domain-containing protein
MLAPAMRSRLAFAAAGAAAFAALTLLAPRRAEAYDVLAVPCTQSELTCGTGAVSFKKVDALPIQWSFDTGWVPQGSPLQVHIWADVWANTYVNLAGSLQSSWPTAMVLDAPGAKEGGAFGFHYGADFGAQGKITISVLGKNYSWQGDLPYVPQFDLEVKDDTVFDAWGYDPGVKISGKTMPQQIAQVSISDIVGGSIPGIDGGFELDVAVELAATYVTKQVVVTTTDGQPVAGGPFTKDGDQSSTPYTNGPNIELDIHPEGTVNYDGIVHLIPAFYVSLLGSSWQIPIVDIPISFPITETDWIFDKQRVHFPLPDLALSQQVLDFGEIQVGENKSLDYQLWNAGEALAAAAMSTSDPVVFPVFQSSAAVLPGLTTQATVSFTPMKEGDFTGQLTVASNDPNAPLQTILLKGKAKAPPTPPPTTTPPTEMGEPMAADEHSSCACRTAGDTGGSAGALAMAALGAVLAVRRRRRG